MTEETNDNNKNKAANNSLVEAFLWASGILFLLGSSSDNAIAFAPSCLAVVGAIAAMFKR